jgi:hypothetical protein
VAPIVGSRQLVPFPPSDDPLPTRDPWLPASPNGANSTGWVTARSTPFVVQQASGLLISNVAVQVSDAGVLTASLRFSGVAGKITSVAACGGATGLGCAWILFEPDYGTGFRLWGPYLDCPGLDSGVVSSGDIPQSLGTLLGPMSVKVTLIDNAGNRSNTVAVPVAHWFQW